MKTVQDLGGGHRRTRGIVKPSTELGEDQNEPPFLYVRTGHPSHKNEDGTWSDWDSHAADQPYRNPKANDKELDLVFDVLARAANAHYGVDRGGQKNRERAGRLIDLVVRMNTREEIRAFLGMPIGPEAPSYTALIDENSHGQARVRWSVEKIDSSVGVPETLLDRAQSTALRVLNRMGKWAQADSEMRARLGITTDGSSAVVSPFMFGGFQ